jgi:putative protein-disulfide isomerase
MTGQRMTGTTLHYIYDPLCGWCYGFSPLVHAARGVSGLTIRMHGGGMLAGHARQLVTAGLREFIMTHVPRVTAMTKARFGEAYTEGLLRDPTAMLDSEPATAAVLAAEGVAGRGLDMLKRIQNAHYLDGARVVERKELIALGVDIGLDSTAFEAEFARMLGAIVQSHIDDSRRLLTRVGGQGFPTFALEKNGRFEIVELGRWLGQPDAWEAALAAKVAN